MSGGKTFRMLGLAVAAVADGQDVIIVAHNMAYARELRRRVVMAVKAMGADMSRVKVEARSDHDPVKLHWGLQGSKKMVFRDHYTRYGRLL